MSTIWHPYTESPEPFVNVRLRFGDNGAWVDSTTQAVFDLVEYLGPENSLEVCNEH